MTCPGQVKAGQVGSGCAWLLMLVLCLLHTP